ncbi:sugar phosphate isomerase/epimerase family protein [Streptomyces sp. NPDC001508]|uniref:sugar phosphate isomerase/epimerase family protein n=1 Tax=Streptomyces sp. NPDC001508 TaxID=3154656 RepID=UPI00331F969E
MRLSCADYTWPLLPHAAALDLIRAIGCDAVDLGFMSLRSHIRPEQEHGAIAYAAGAARERVTSRGLAIADVFAIPYTDFETMAVNNPDPAQQDRSFEFFLDAVEFAQHVGAPGITTLPGVLFGGESFGQALARSAEGLNRRVELAASRGLELSVEPHTGSLIDTPEKTLRLLESVSGLRITLDPAHYVYADVPQREIEPLLTHVRHLQCRPGRPGKLQVAVSEDAIDWTPIVSTLHQQGFSGYLALEYVWQEWMDCNRVDTVAESVLLRDLLLAAVRSYRSRAEGVSV